MGEWVFHVCATNNGCHVVCMFVGLVICNIRKKGLNYSHGPYTYKYHVCVCVCGCVFGFFLNIIFVDFL